MLQKTDMVGTIIEKWFEKRIGKVLFCNLCKKDINHDKGGINQVNQHMLSLKDKKA